MLQKVKFESTWGLNEVILEYNRGGWRVDQIAPVFDSEGNTDEVGLLLTYDAEQDRTEGKVEA